MARNNWADELVDILNQYVDEECKTIDQVFEQTANDTCQMVRQASPGSGEYASGWEVIRESGNTWGGFKVGYTVGNPEHYRLTHLLEKGHAVKNQYGGPSRPGKKKRVRGRRHIAPAEKKGTELLLSRLRKDL